MQKCQSCLGNGYFVSSNSKLTTKCPRCKGLGEIKSTNQEIIQNAKKLAVKLNQKPREEVLKEFGKMLDIVSND